MLADNRREKQPSRCHAYQHDVKVSELSFNTLAEYELWRKRGRQTAAAVLAKSDFTFWIAGNHVGVLPLLEQLGHGSGTMVIQFDAHLDVYNLTDCTTELSHGNF